MKKFLSTLLALCLMMALTPVNALAADVTISTLQQLQTFAVSVNNGDTYEGKTVELAANINLSGAWTPIGNGSRSGSGYSVPAFKGTFNGNGYTISGLTNPSGMGGDTTFGLFGVVDGGTVKNLKLSNVSINTGNENVGAAIGLMVNNATADGISVLSGSVTAPDGVGGVVGRMTVEGTIKNCSNAANVTATGSGGAGGIVGKAYYTQAGKEMNISNCANTGTISSSYAAGGIVGLSASNVKNCTNTGRVSAGTEAGGIVGEQVNYGEVSGNANSGVVANQSGSGTAYGGIIGWVRYQNAASSYANNETILVSNNQNSANISASGAALGAGGIVGSAYNQLTATNNVNTASSIIGGTFAAGIVGGPQPSSDNLKLPGETVAVTGNYSTTPLSMITASFTDLFAYNNQPGEYIVENNSTTLPTSSDADSTAPSIPQTGDNSQLALWFFLLLLSGAAFAALRRKVNG